MPIGLVVAMLVGAQATSGAAPIEDKHVRARIALMNSQKYALEGLIALSSGRVPYDSRAARNLRKQLLATTKDIDRRFRKQRDDPNSHAKPEVWIYWDDFKARAKRAEAATKAVKTWSLEDLRGSLPNLIRACHSCHQSFREHVNEFTTH
ncbi:c-type cytochrome [Tritonibacter horizontis]|uniref:Cytochrome c-556 n=1 Tax=Tritonibacter horizontis TaxID=1768241 RepID=A0A132BXB5_9RHOB|nr:cytochrome c [Tritonibacter horizontis]KUP93008.1 cytochrome c-556 [Tritonibacter horizontis]